MNKRNLLLVILLQLALGTYAQAPQKMSYQSVVRNASNQIVANQDIGVKISIVEGSITGTSVYSETHTATTNASGLFTLEAGGGTPTNGTFSAINWGNGSHYIKSEIDVTGGTNYALSGTMELLSVPYALYAGKSGSASLINTTVEPAGTNCANGGTKIEVGLDANNNGVLENAEVNGAQTKYVCNGNGNNSYSQPSQGVRVGFSSSTIWTCPAGITKITVELWGGGGGGGSSSGCVYRWNGAKCYTYYNQGNIGSIAGGKGGKGGYNRAVINVVPGTTYSIIVGNGGSGGIGGCSIAVNNGTDGAIGQQSQFIDNGNALLVANGGLAGTKGIVGCDCPVKQGTITTYCSGGITGSDGINAEVVNYTSPLSVPTNPSYIPSNYLSPIASCCANYGEGGLVNNLSPCVVASVGDNNYPKFEYSPIPGSNGENGFCAITY